MDSGQWSFLLDTAKDYGWMPKGTVCSTLDDPETWTGEYIGVPLVYMDWDDVDGMVKALRSAASKAGEEVAAAVGDEARKIGLGLVLIRRFIEFRGVPGAHD
jgi:hypothetical protein